MQSDKASKKTRAAVSELVANASTEVSAGTEKTAKPLAAKSSPSKSETPETSSAKRHRKAATVSAPEPVAEEVISAPKTMAAAAGSRSAASVIVDPVGVEMAPAAVPAAAVSRERIEQMAYHFWLQDGRPDGNHFEHWLRAERELGAVR